MSNVFEAIEAGVVKHPAVLGTAVKMNPRNLPEGYSFGDKGDGKVSLIPEMIPEGYEHIGIVLTGPDGNVKEAYSLWNTVTTAGKNAIADQLLVSPTLGKATHMAIGTGTPTGTALGSELDRNAFSSTQTRSGAVVTYFGFWAAGDGTGAITEAGTFDASSSGNMWMSASFAVVNKLAADTLSITWTLTVA